VSARVEVRSVRRIATFRPEAVLVLPRPRLLQWVRPCTTTEEAVEVVAREAPLGPDVVEWMQHAAAANAVLDVYAQQLEACSATGGELRWGSGDPFIPGVRVDDEFYAVSEPWRAVNERGFGRVRTPCGEQRVPVGGKALLVCPNFLGWGVLPGGWTVQWLLTLLRWVRLPRLPLTRRVTVPVVHGRTAPFFAEYVPRAPLPLATLRLVVGSERPQTLVLRGRSANNYAAVLWEQRVDVDEGEHEVLLTLFQLPYVASQVLEIQGRDGVRLYVTRLEGVP